MTRPEGNMLTMRIIKLLGIAGVAVLAACWMADRVQRREAEQRRTSERAIWSGNAGKAKAAPATAGPATQSAVTAH